MADKGPYRALAEQLRLEAEVARTSPRGKHPEVDVQTHAAALLFAARLVEQAGGRSAVAEDSPPL